MAKVPHGAADDGAARLAGRPILAAESVSKRYGRVQALDNVSASIYPGEIHAVLGENGAGKSTLMGVFAGSIVPDSGRCLHEGQSLPMGRPAEVRRRKIALVHQHFMLVPQFTVAENLALDQLDSVWGAVDQKQVVKRAQRAAEEVGWSFDPSARTNTLPVGVQQRLEILKALAMDAEIIILDEPTAVLSPDEVDDLIRVLRRLAASGKTVVLIAHKLSEVFAAADRVTVLRRGRLVGCAPIGDLTPDTLADWMVGAMPDQIPMGQPKPGALTALRADGLVVKGARGETAVRGASLAVREGEILGIGGVDGNGQIELAEALAGARPLAAGSLETTVRAAYIPQDRQVDGLAMDMPIWENMLVGSLDDSRLFRGPLLRRGKALEWASHLVGQFSIKAGSVLDAARSLSGGNQQKVIVSRILSQKPGLIVAVNPTRGLDIKATRFVHSQLLSAAAQGAGIVLFSTDLDELAALATRTVFMSRGALVQGGSSAMLGGTA